MNNRGITSSVNPLLAFARFSPDTYCHFCSPVDWPLSALTQSVTLQSLFFSCFHGEDGNPGSRSVCALSTRPGPSGSGHPGSPSACTECSLWVAWLGAGVNMMDVAPVLIEFRVRSPQWSSSPQWSVSPRSVRVSRRILGSPLESKHGGVKELAPGFMSRLHHLLAL